MNQLQQQQQHQQQQQQPPQQQPLVVCRCCLVENPPLYYNIYNDRCLYGALSECVPQVRFEAQDGLTDSICEQCWWQVRETNEFRRRCLYADQELRRRSDEATHAIEEALDLMDDLFKEQCGSAHSETHLNELKPISRDFVALESPRLEEPRDLPSGTLDMTLLNDLWLDECSFSSIPTDSSVPNSDLLSNNELLNDVFDAFGNSLPSWDLSADSLCSFSLDNLGDLTRTTSSAPLQETSYGLTEPQVTNLARPNEPPLSVGKPPQKPRKPAGQQKSLHSCPECEKKFTRNFQLKLHLISVHNIGDGLQYHCSECEKTFASRHSLNYHQKSIHSKERPFACTECSRRFILRTQLVSHQRTHTGELKPRTHPCPECDKNFLTKSDLRTHYTRSHCTDVEKPYKCEYCEKSFFTRSHLGSHRLVHTGEKPYVCVVCGKSYQGVGNLNNHLVRRHGELLLGGGGGSGPHMAQEIVV